MNFPCKVVAVIWLMEFSGCGAATDAPQLEHASGIVTYQGQPLPNAQIVFVPEIGPVASGESNAQGVFSLMTQGKAGAPRGKHQVTISAFEPEAPIDPKKPVDVAPNRPVDWKPPASRIPQKYGSLKKSGLTAVVEESGENQFEFDLR